MPGNNDIIIFIYTITNQIGILIGSNINIIVPGSDDDLNVNIRKPNINLLSPGSDR